MESHTTPQEHLFDDVTLPLIDSQEMANLLADLGNVDHADLSIDEHQFNDILSNLDLSPTDTPIQMTRELDQKLPLSFDFYSEPSYSSTTFSSLSLPTYSPSSSESNKVNECSLSPVQPPCIRKRIVRILSSSSSSDSEEEKERNKKSRVCLKVKIEPDSVIGEHQRDLNASPTTRMSTGMHPWLHKRARRMACFNHLKLQRQAKKIQKSRESLCEEPQIEIATTHKQLKQQNSKCTMSSSNCIAQLLHQINLQQQTVANELDQIICEQKQLEQKLAKIQKMNTQLLKQNGLLKNVIAQHNLEQIQYCEP